MAGRCAPAGYNDPAWPSPPGVSAIRQTRHTLALPVTGLVSPSQCETLYDPRPPGGNVAESPAIVGRAWRTGEIIEGLYRVERILGQGGMSVVYLAADLAADRRVVIKCLLRDKARDPGIKQRFATEAEEWVRLGVHPNIVRAYTVVESEWLPRIVAEYIDGPTLADILDQGALALPRAVALALHVCHGMAYAHDRGIAHCDLKPGNVLVTKDDVAKVSDFGLVRRIGEQERLAQFFDVEHAGRDRARADGIVGTPEYMAPEQWECRAGPAADVYAFGVMLFEMLTGRRPFAFPELRDMAEVHALRNAHVNTPPPELVRLRRGLPEPLVALVKECLEKDSGMRPPHFRTVARKLAAAVKPVLGAVRLREPAPAELDRAGLLDRAYGFLRLGKGCYFRGDYPRARKLYDDAAAVFREQRDDRGLGLAEQHAAALHVLRGELDAALALLRSSWRRLETVGDDGALADVRLRFGYVYRQQGDYPRAIAEFEASLAHAERLVDSARTAHALHNIGLVRYWQGDNAGAAEVIRKGLGISETAGDYEGMSYCYNSLGIVLLATGDLAGAETAVRRSLELRHELGNRRGVALCQQNLGNIAARRGAHDDTIRAFEAALAQYDSLGDTAGMAECFYNIALEYQRAERPADAVAVLQRLIPLADRHGHLETAMSARLELAQCALQGGDAPGAAAILEDCVARCETGGLPALAEEARLLLAHAREMRRMEEE